MFLRVDYIVLISVWCVTILGLLYFVPRNKIREAIAIFLFKQSLTWLFGLMVVQLGLIEYPVREFPKASHTSFSFEYFIYPATCVVFNLHFPVHKSLVHKIGWFLFFPTWMTILEVLIAQNTELIHYIHWAWYWSWITLFLTFLFSFIYYRWFFKIKPGSPVSS
ncbi:CBO0543 family protein [Bacillus sp. 1NLA3E]|uniref:CBO0543 family protein n=1 Tax=Bacillus sp. 1NLA3E TaxID=666686 RepID=UPI000327FDF6|nr:CBO0543 family protein [Bacillus sp. 1NLA3E]AGK55834.1 hypothetical protein B1NLA3E_20480 [Bacillus sp. 1NLA3E]